MSHDLQPGFDKKDLAKPPTIKQIKAEHTEINAYAVYVRNGGDEEAAARELQVTRPQARVLINRGRDRYLKSRMSDIDHIRARQGMELDIMRKPLIERAAEGHNPSTETLLKVQKREADLFGSDAVKERDNGPQVIVIDARYPWEREAEVIDGEVVGPPTIDPPSETP